MTNLYHSSTGLHAQGVIQSSNLKVGEHQIHYLEAGNGSPVVLVHGGASDCRDWVETIAVLSHSYGVYAPDLPGYGLSGSDGRSGYYLSDFVEFIIKFIQMLGLDSSVLVGHSLGGRACLEIALRHPEMVHRLVLIDSAGFGKLTRWGMFLGITAWAMRKILRRPQPYPKFLWKDNEDRDWFCLEELPALQVPTLMIWNRHDPYHPLGGALRARELIPESYLEVLPGYGHAPHVKKRDLFNNLLLSFIERE